MQYNISFDDVKRQVLDFMNSLGIEPYEESDLYYNGEICRFRTKEDKSGQKSGAVCIYTDGWPAGFVQDWRKGIKEDWRYDASGLSDEQRTYFNSDEFKKKCEEQERKARLEREAKQQEAIDSARRFWESSSPAPDDHAYLRRKNVKNYGLHINPYTGDLVVPLRDVDGKLISLQFISGDRDKGKLFHPGAPLIRAFYSIALETLKENPSQPILLGEGYATMAKVYELSGLPCVAAMTCHNLWSVASVLHKTYPDSKIIVTADNDWETEKEHGYNPGLREAQHVMNLKLAVGIAAPEFTDAEAGNSDWNDYALIHGDAAAGNSLTDKIHRVLFSERIEKYRVQAQEFGLVKKESFKEFIMPPKDPDFLIDGWLPGRGLVMLFAPTGSGKGFLTLDMALSIACEDIHEWKGHKVLKHGHVIYFAGEGQRGMRKRCAGLCHELNLDPSRVKMDIISDAFPIDDSDPRAGVKRAIANIGNIDINQVLAIFDTTNRYMIGDENKTVDANAYIRACQMIIDEFNCTVMTIHHTGLSPDAQKRARGSSVFKGALDVELFLSRENSVLTIEMTKAKDFEEASPMKLVMHKVEVPDYFRSDGTPDTTCVLLTPDESIEANLLPPQETPAAEKLTEKEELAKRSYSDAAREHGRIIYDKEQDKEIAAVSLEDWRQVYYGLSGEKKSGTKRQNFNRAIKIMLEKLQLLYEQELDGEEYYCLKPTGHAYEMGILLHLRRKQDGQVDSESVIG